MNASKVFESVDKSNLNKERQNQVLLELCLLESDFYVQARNFLLMSILTYNDNSTETTSTDVRKRLFVMFITNFLRTFKILLRMNKSVSNTLECK